MTTTAQRPGDPLTPVLRDPRGAGDELVRAALGPGADVVDLLIERVQPRSDGLSLGLDVTLAGGVRDYLVASSAPVALAAAARGQGALLRRPGQEASVAVWRHPFDPELPGLALATTLERVARLLPLAAGLEVVTYRPLRRAVVRVTGRDGAPLAYLKIVPPRHGAALAARHRACGLAPRVLAVPEPGVLVLEARREQTLAEVLITGGSVPPLGELVDLDLTLTTAAARLSPVAPWSAHVEAAVARCTDLLEPAAARRATAMAALVARLAGAGAPDAVTHGDLHPGNVLVAEGAVVGLLDLDRLGPGRREDDLACLLAHTAVLARQGVTTAGAALREWWGDVDSPRLRARTAAVLLGLVATARDAVDLIDLAEETLLGDPGPSPTTTLATRPLTTWRTS